MSDLAILSLRNGAMGWDGETWTGRGVCDPYLFSGGGCGDFSLRILKFELWGWVELEDGSCLDNE